MADGSRVVVTGGAGFLGSTLVALLLKQGCRVVVLDDMSAGFLRNLPLDHPDLTVRVGRIGATAFAAVLEEEIAAADAVIHLASPIGVRRAHVERYAVTRSILDSTGAVVDACLRCRCPLLFASSSEVYGAGQGQPISESASIVTDIRARWGYAAAKAACEHLVAALFHEFGVPAWIVRPFNMAGARQRASTGQVIPSFIAAALQGEPIVIHDDGNQRRSFLHVADAAEALILVMQSKALLGRPVNLGSNEAIRISELARLVVETVGTAVPIVRRPSAAVFGEGFAATRDRIPDIDLIRSVTGWQPTRTVRRAIADCVAHLGSARNVA